MADSGLAGVEKGLTHGDKASKFLKALSVLGVDVEGAAAVSAADAKRTPAANTPIHIDFILM